MVAFELGEVVNPIFEQAMNEQRRARDQFRVACQARSNGVYNVTFNSEGDTYFDVRFFAESPLQGWVDDVFVEEQTGGR